jgi:hypothetical protein
MIGPLYGRLRRGSASVRRVSVPSMSARHSEPYQPVRQSPVDLLRPALTSAVQVDLAASQSLTRPRQMNHGEREAFSQVFGVNLCAYWVIDPPKSNLRDEQLLGLAYSNSSLEFVARRPLSEVLWPPILLFTGALREWTTCASSRGNTCATNIARHELA